MYYCVPVCWGFCKSVCLHACHTRLSGAHVPMNVSMPAIRYVTVCMCNVSLCLSVCMHVCLFGCVRTQVM